MSVEELRKWAGLPDDGPRKARICLGCKVAFVSEWAGNRTCDDCHQRQKSGIDLEGYGEKDEIPKTKNKKIKKFPKKKVHVHFGNPTQGRSVPVRASRKGSGNLGQ